MKIRLILIFSIFCISYNMNGQNWSKQWEEIDNFTNNGLPKSALEAVTKLKNQAKNTDQQQYIKALLYELRLEKETEDQGITKYLNLFEEEIAAANQPSKAILSSFLGEVYAQYISINSWRLKDVTNTTAYRSDSIETWSANQLLDKSLYFYNLSLDQSTLNYQAKDYKELVIGANDLSKYSLYDLLVSRALDFYTNEGYFLTQPTYAFRIDQPSYYAPIEEFMKLDINSLDTLGGRFQAIKLFQNSARNYASNGDRKKLAKLDFKRLTFVNNNSNVVNKTELYGKSLEAGMKNYKDVDEVCNFYFAYVQYLSQIQPVDNVKIKAICEEAIRLYPNAEGAANCQNYLVQLLKKSINISSEGVQIPNKAFLVKVDYKNITNCYYKIVKIDFEKNLTKKERRDYDVKKILEQLLKKKTVMDGHFALPDFKDYNIHSTEIFINALKEGKYAIICSDESDFNYNNHNVCFAEFQVSNLSLMTQRNTDTHNYILNRTNGETISGATIDIYHQVYRNEFYDFQKEGTLTSDSKGVFDNIKQIQRYNQYLLISKGNDTLEINNFYSYDYERYFNYPRQATYFFTDRAIYRPGQEVFVKCLLVNTDNATLPQILPNTNTEITFYDVNNQKIATKNLISNEFGTVNTSFIIPTEVLTGNFALQASSGDRINIKVEEYKRPTFSTLLNKPEKEYSYNDNISLEGNATAFAGYGLQDAKVAYSIERKQIRYWGWWYFRPYHYNRIPFDNDQSQVIEIGTTTTDADGKFIINFKALPPFDLDSYDMSEYHVTAKVTSTNGETHEETIVVKVGNSSLVLNAVIPDRAFSSELKKIKVETKNLNDKFVSTDVKLVIYKYADDANISRKRNWEAVDTCIIKKDDFKKLLSYDNYNNDQPEKNKVFTKEIKTLENGDFDIPYEFKTGNYFIELTAKDKNGKEVKFATNTKVYEAVEQSKSAIDLFWSKLEKNVVEPGNDAIIWVAAAKPLQLFLSINYKDGTSKEEWIKVEGLKKIKIPVTEKDRGGINYSLSAVLWNRTFQDKNTITVPWSNKKLTITYETFRDKILPGAEEEWKIRITGADKNKAVAELLTTMYDESLDEFVPHQWNLNIFPSNYFQNYSQFFAFSPWSLQCNYLEDKYFNHDEPQPYFNNFSILSLIGNNYFYRGYAMGMAAPSVKMKNNRKMEAADMEVQSLSENDEVVSHDPEAGGDSDKVSKVPKEENNSSASNDAPRTNLKETVFFYPNIETDVNGDVLIKFKMNEALTKWKWMLFAHTKQLDYAIDSKSLITQKDLFVQPNYCRFLRQGDTLVYSTLVVNKLDKPTNCEVSLALKDIILDKDLQQWISKSNKQSITIPANSSASVFFTINVPNDYLNPISFTTKVSDGTLTDAEQKIIPVLTNRQLVTEALPLPIRSNQEKNFKLQSLANNNSTTLQNYSYTIEYTSNPVWYVVQSLPYLMEYPYECSEQVFNRFYANRLGKYITDQNPEIASTFDIWRQYQPDALKSNLQKNEEFKAIKLQETPWLNDALSEQESKYNIARFFEKERLESELSKSLKKLSEKQRPDGGFGWFPGDYSNTYITLLILEGFGQLEKRGVLTTNELNTIQTMRTNAIAFVDNAMIEYYNQLMQNIKRYNGNPEDDHLDYFAIYYWFVRSYYKNELSQPLFNIKQYYFRQMDKYGMGKGLFAEANIAMTYFRNSETNLPKRFLKSFRERAIKNDELGMYWKSPNGYFWYQRPIETHCKLMEAFAEIDADKNEMDEMKIWLLKNKQTNKWETTKATANAVYAMMFNGNNYLKVNEPVKVWVAKKPVEFKQFEAGTLYTKVQFPASEINNSFADIKVANPNPNIAWGAAYWQYFEDMDKIKTFNESPLKMVKSVFKRIDSQEGGKLVAITENEPLNLGDKIVVRIEIYNDREMEFVHLKDSRASNLEPVNTISEYKWKGGLGYYESTKDAATNFFISYLPKGNYVFEYELYANQKGACSAGIANLQCMYAPEFSSHSNGLRINVK